jgi:hypothetical protein
VPQAVFEQPAPATAHEIAKLGLELGTGVSVAVRAAFPPVLTEDGPLTAKPKVLVIVTIAVAFFDGSARLVAEMVSVGGEGMICGAVKRPFELIEPQEELEQPDPLSAQVIPPFGVPAEMMFA